MPVLERTKTIPGHRGDLEYQRVEVPGVVAEDEGRDDPGQPTLPPGGDREPQPGRNVPAGLAVVLIILVAVLLTYLGMLTQIWANLSGAQLPGA